MKTNKLHKIIGISFSLLIIVSLCLLLPTYAEETPTTEETQEICKDAIEQNIQERYNLVLEKVSPQQYKIYMNGDKEDLDGAEFKIIGAGEYSYGSTTITGGEIKAIGDLANITKNNPVTFNAIPYNDGEEEILVVTVELVKGTTSFVTDCTFTENLIVKDYGGDTISSIYDQEADNEHSKDKYGSICYNFFEGIWNESQFVGIKKSDFESYNYKAVAGQYIDGKSVQNVYLDTLDYCTKSKVSSSAKYTQERIANMMGNVITYAKSRLKTTAGSQTFAELFEFAKLNGVDKSGKTPTASLKCDWKNVDTTTDYYVNKNYFYKTEKEEPEKATYTYHYAPGDTQTKTENVCQRTCSEAVKLEYGPPVASKAGLCFEYKVKVTSYVECTSEILTPPPTQSYNYCSPAPFCHEKNWKWQGEQAGPTEEFDSCILECDGGKYTDKCSVDCYKKVYKNSKIKLAVDYENVLANKMAYLSDEVDTCISESSDGGCYYWSGDSIYWKSIYQDGEYSNNASSLGRWYRENGKDWLNRNGKSYVVSTNGIKTAHYGGSSYCQDVCYWKTSTCSKGQYLNPNNILSDNEANFKEYQAAVTKCEASATCTNTTAEFEISVNYNSEKEGGGIKTNKVTFPYSTGKDRISSKGNGSANLNTATSLSDTTILDYAGCYNESSEKNWYMTEWSFPGTYIHNKTGEISFKVPSDPSGWYYENRKFCVPLDAVSTHTKWWEWYTIYNANTNLTDFCYTATDIENELASEGYNIKATATNFGYYGWNFTVDCFYALRNEECNIEETDKCCPPDTKKTGINYTVRSIDRKNLFPNATVSGVIDDTKRDIGFNWTSKARISELKNASYSVDPEKLIQDIQSKADTLYNDETNLDYQFYLTPSTLNEIRKYNDKYDYGVWNGKTEQKNGIYVYLSNLWNQADHDVEKSVDLRSISGAVVKTGTPGENNED